MTTQLLEADRCYSIVGAFLEIFHYFGPGLSEKIYSKSLELALKDRGHEVAREVSVEITFKGRHVGWQRIDMVVDQRIVVELKATDRLSPYAEAQIMSYLRATRFEVGLLLHAGVLATWKRFIDSPKRQHRFAPIAQIRSRRR